MTEAEENKWEITIYVDGKTFYTYRSREWEWAWLNDETYETIQFTNKITKEKQTWYKYAALAKKEIEVKKDEYKAI